MKTVCKLNQCTGCMACVERCPVKAVTVRDSIQFYNACIDLDRCIGCNRCHSICPVNAPPAFQEPSIWRQGWAMDCAIRESAASGGIASAIETSFVRQGGIVFSCRFQEGSFRFGKAEKPEQIRQFTGSKYVKSSPEGIYREIGRLLSGGRKVLFVGLPCQAAAVRNVAGDQSALYVIDLICHGTPSPRLLEMYLRDRGYSLKEISRLSFRKKNRFGLMADGKAVASEGVWDAYTTAFCDAVSYTEACYSCQYAQLYRVSDLTLGDSWGSQLPMTEQRAGISLVLCQNRKGEELLTMADLHLEEVSLERAVSYNQQLCHASRPHKKRGSFLEMVEKTGSVQKAAWKCFPIKFLKKSIKAFALKWK